MNQELLLKESLLYFALACIAAGSPLLSSNYVAGLILYVLAGVSIGARSYMKTKEVQPNKK